MRDVVQEMLPFGASTDVICAVVFAVTFLAVCVLPYILSEASTNRGPGDTPAYESFLPFSCKWPRDGLAGAMSGTRC